MFFFHQHCFVDATFAQKIFILICVTCIHFIRLFCWTHAFYSAFGAQVFCQCIFSIIINTGKVKEGERDIWFQCVTNTKKLISIWSLPYSGLSNEEGTFGISMWKWKLLVIFHQTNGRWKDNLCFESFLSCLCYFGAGKHIYPCVGEVGKILE